VSIVVQRAESAAHDEAAIEHDGLRETPHPLGLAAKPPGRHPRRRRANSRALS
jgi:hypothetical protein